MSEFSDRPFVAGSLTGLRAFSVDSLGRLTGVSHRAVFKPGENVGECRGLSGPALTFTTMQADLARQFGMPAPVVRKAGKHPVGAKDCSCGFYAYFDGSNTYARPADGTVEAIIEGYGTCTVGSRGFRAEKARLVALIEPTIRGTRSRWDEFSGWCDEHDALVLPACMGIMVGGFVLGIGLGASVSPWLFALLLVAVLAVVGIAASFHGIDVTIDHRTPRTPVNFDRVRANYPDVPVYRTRREALAAHPLTVPPAPTPETDEDFWTRAVES